MTLTPAELNALLRGLSPKEMADMLVMLDELDERKRMQAARDDFLAFIALVDKTYKFGTHLRRLGGLLADVEQGVKDRVAVSMGPRFGKSQMISIYYPAWYLGRNPDHKVIVASHTADLAMDMSRKVRNLMQTAEYQAIFPAVRVAGDAKAAGKWNTNKGGELFSIGVGGALAGRGGHLIIVDDPISEQALKSSNFSALDDTYEWFRAGLRTRLMPGGRIVVLHCLTGDTKVRQADGTDKLIQDVRPGDVVASYTPDGFVPAKVLGWANQGVDHIFSIALNSGVIIRGNARHPLLVRQNGEDRWVTIKNLKPGMMLVTTGDSAALPMGAQNPQKQKQGRALAALATYVSGITKKIQRLRTTRLGTMVSGLVKRARPRAAGSLRTPKGSVLGALQSRLTQIAKRRVTTTARLSGATHISKCSMESPGTITTGCLKIKGAFVNYAANPQTKQIPLVLGKLGVWLSTIVTALGKFAHCCAIRATLSSRSETPPNYFAGPLSILSISLDEIVSIAFDGEEEVFDIQVEGTENFLANGVVSHNTRWHQRDLIGRLVKDSALNPEADQYEVFEFPAVLNEGAENEKSLWPEQWSLESLQKTKASMPLWQWNSQYQQNPTAAESAIIKREWIKWWPKEDPPKVDFIIQSWDTALTTKARSDWSVCQTWGVWQKEDESSTNLILLNCAKGKWEFPELKQAAHDQYEAWQPDSVIVEAKASGQPLIDEMRRSGIFVQDFSPGKGQDKIARLNAVADMFAAGHVWFPETAWANSVVEELLSFPSGEHDDQVDALTLALRRARTGGLLRLSTDYEDNEALPPTRHRGAYTI